MQNKLKEEWSYSHDEVDLRLVLDRISRGFKAFSKNVKFVLRVMIRRALLLVLFVLVGIGIGYSIYKTAKPYYTSSMTLVLAEIRNQFVENQFKRLSVMVEEDNNEAVARELDITVDAAMQIKELEFFNLDQERIAEDSVLIGSPFEVQVSMYSNELFKVVGPALVTYLENNPYFASKKNVRQREIEGKIAKLKESIASIDSIKTTVVSPTGPVNGFVYGQPIDPTNLYREGLEMYEQQAELEAELDLLNNIQIVNSFTPRLRPTGPNLIKYLAVGGGIAFVIGVIVAVNLERRRRNKLI
ncbi:hypothetical protein [Pontibacter actiniarum]|uniref:Chain length determinant protein n=1 Tax=Pontibacter actiniarum TaxID=323450 RepID=A0A1X9YPF9_9BACT|nr:hypothetical protein [Pontibacter actiniarum]ARS34778.1 chain length determinant protein [Pontibacter actiniarum]